MTTPPSPERASVWLEFSPLAQACSSINLGQGFPDWAPPPFVQVAAQEACQGSKFSTYARSPGHMPLVDEIAKAYCPKLDRSIDPKKNVLVTVGASEAIYLAIRSHIKAGNEVVLLEPAFDIYFGALRMAGATVKSVPLDIPGRCQSSEDITIPWDKIRSALSDKTRAIIINTPHNPTGKVFTPAECQQLATVLEPYPNCLVIADEVYEHLVYDHKKHVPIARTPGLASKTLSIYSAGKTFSVTGWKIGWVIGDRDLIYPMQLNQQWVVFSVATPLQEAIARSLQQAELAFDNQKTYYEALTSLYEGKRDRLIQGLRDIGFHPMNPEGSFFVCCDISSGFSSYQGLPKDLPELYQRHGIDWDHDTQSLLDYNVVRHLSLSKGVTTIPTSAFFVPSHRHGSNCHWIRFAFCKSDHLLDQAIEQLG
ncbi:aminotransferase class I/II-fold pyridoxal phosphate-dependent enzyme [Pseudobacteriovorax antillogorgiicola]|uniref:Glutamine-phenylpyruvate transaminase n=1 Tax=Pseudobacteriovorax antillogorgiicola TaxID=1513793 RepID=A0A1Y6BZ47_9BACT|nr:aminotransferase class I/II-fold pyridoxal phosphate-dependent enzyme [Pseudobacteriovorax antillogorgiicola]TCS53125.1 glutamine-phenylpyruvate transaminase [Pseudobacteriovorax antillogorgiicola]SMF25435.1 glutamine-phenylpyruvate transaminase [Pseudobacteriovorax antillogorgiicola]